MSAAGHPPQSTTRAGWPLTRSWWVGLGVLLGTLLVAAGLSVLAVRHQVRQEVIEQAVWKGYTIDELEGFSLSGPTWHGWFRPERVTVRRLVARSTKAPHARWVATGVTLELRSKHKPIQPSRADPAEPPPWPFSEPAPPTGRVRAVHVDQLSVEAIGPAFAAWEDLFLSLEPFIGTHNPFDVDVRSVAIALRLAPKDQPLLECHDGWIHVEQGKRYSLAQVTQHDSPSPERHTTGTTLPGVYEPGRCQLLGKPVATLPGQQALEISPLFTPAHAPHGQFELAATLWLSVLGAFEINATITRDGIRALFPEQVSRFRWNKCPAPWDWGNNLKPPRSYPATLSSGGVRDDGQLPVAGWKGSYPAMFTFGGRIASERATKIPMFGRHGMFLCGYTPPLPGELEHVPCPPVGFSIKGGWVKHTRAGHRLDVGGLWGSTAPSECGWWFEPRGYIEITREHKRLVLGIPGEWFCRDLWLAVVQLYPGTAEAQTADALYWATLFGERPAMGLSIQADLLVDLDAPERSTVSWYVEPGCGLERYGLALWDYPALPEDFPRNLGERPEPQ